MFVIKKVDSDCYIKQVNFVPDINFNGYCNIQYTCDMSKIKDRFKTKAEAEEAISQLGRLDWHKAKYEIISLRKLDGKRSK